MFGCLRSVLVRRILSVIPVTMLAATAPARAADFTGFYAGVNAGHAIGRDGDRQGGVSSPAPASPSAGAGLPPSALSAADRIEQKRETARRAPAR